MAFGTNYSAAADYGIIPQGEYECIITNAEVRQTPSQKWKVSLTLTIRNDVQQGSRNRVLFMDIWRKKEPNANDAQVEGFNFAQLMNIAKAAAIPDGTNFDSLADFLRTLDGRLLRVTVTHRAYGGRTYEEIDNLRGLSPTKFPECRHVQKQRAVSASRAPVVRRALCGVAYQKIHGGKRRKGTSQVSGENNEGVLNDKQKFPLTKGTPAFQ